MHRRRSARDVAGGRSGDQPGDPGRGGGGQYAVRTAAAGSGSRGSAGTGAGAAAVSDARYATRTRVHLYGNGASVRKRGSGAGVARIESGGASSGNPPCAWIRGRDGGSAGTRGGDAAEVRAKALRAGGRGWCGGGAGARDRAVAPLTGYSRSG